MRWSSDFRMTGKRKAPAVWVAGAFYAKEATVQFKLDSY